MHVKINGVKQKKLNQIKLSFIKYNHTLSNLVAVNQPGQHWSEEMGGVAMNRFGMVFVLTLTLLYSFTVNALVEIIFWNISSKSFLESGFKPTVRTLFFFFFEVQSFVLINY
jgi:hypothetical protein